MHMSFNKKTALQQNIKTKHNVIINHFGQYKLFGVVYSWIMMAASSS